MKATPRLCAMPIGASTRWYRISACTTCRPRRRRLAKAVRVLRPGGRIAFTTWAAPAETIAWRRLFNATHEHGDPQAAKTPPSGGNLGSMDTVLHLSREAGIAD